MKMADGGFRPAYNAQLATDTGSQVIVGVSVTHVGSDQGQMSGMVEQLRGRYGAIPAEYLVDGGFVGLAEIERVQAAGSTVYGPVAKPKDPDRDPHVALPGDSPQIAQWRERMGTEAAKAIYKLRAATSECVNALARNRGLYQLGVRGPEKARAILLWHALAQNLRRSWVLGALIPAGA